MRELNPVTQHFLNTVLGVGNESTKDTALLLLNPSKSTSELHAQFTGLYAGTRIAAFTRDMISRIFEGWVNHGFVNREVIDKGKYQEAELSLTRKGQRRGQLAAANILQFENAQDYALLEILGPFVTNAVGLTTPFIRTCILMELAEAQERVKKKRTVAEIEKSLQIDRAVLYLALIRLNQAGALRFERQRSGSHAEITEKGLVYVTSFVQPLIKALADPDEEEHREVIYSVTQQLPQIAQKTGRNLEPLTMAVREETTQANVDALLKILPLYQQGVEGKTLVDLANELQLSRETVRKYIEFLRESGKVQVVKKSGVQVAYRVEN